MLVKHLDVKQIKMSWIRKILKNLEANQLQNSTNRIQNIVTLHKKNKFKTYEEHNTKE